MHSLISNQRYGYFNYWKTSKRKDFQATSDNVLPPHRYAAIGNNTWEQLIDYVAVSAKHVVFCTMALVVQVHPTWEHCCKLFATTDFSNLHAKFFFKSYRCETQTRQCRKIRLVEWLPHNYVVPLIPVFVFSRLYWNSNFYMYGLWKLVC